MLNLYKLFAAQLVKRGSVKFVKVVPPSLLVPFTHVYKAGWDSVRHLGY